MWAARTGRPRRSPPQVEAITASGTAEAHCGARETGFYLWYDEVAGGRWPTRPDDKITAWIIDVGEATQQIVDPIEFE